MIIDGITANLDGHISNLEGAKSALLGALVADGALDEAFANQINSQYAGIMYKEKWYKRLFKSPDDCWTIRFVKLKTAEVDE